MSTMDVSKGQMLVHCSDRNTNAYIYGLVEVKNQTKTGIINLTNGHSFDIYGWAKGKAHGVVRELRDGETEESIKQIVADRKAEAQAKKDAEAAKRQQAIDDQNVIVQTWMDRPGNVIVTEVTTILGSMFLVNLAIKNRPTVLVLTFSPDNNIWGSKGFRVHIASNEQRDGYMSGGSSSGTCETIDPKAVAKEWLRSWSWTEELK